MAPITIAEWTRATRDFTEDLRNEERLEAALAAVAGPRAELRALERAPDYDARLAEAEAALSARGLLLSPAEEAPTGWRLLFAERAAQLAEELDVVANGRVLDGCGGRCRACPQQSWCDFGRGLSD